MLEKIARDSGFDRMPRRSGLWLVCGSSHFGETAFVRAGQEPPTVEVALTKRSRTSDVGTLPGVSKVQGEDWNDDSGESRTLYGVLNDDVLSKLLAVVASEARARRESPLERFVHKTANLPRSTEIERTVLARVGQDIFRDALIEYWDGACALTGLNVVSLLRASHSKPWSKCESDAERLDVYNGFLLSPNVDAAFDGGWITFNADGRIRVSTQLASASALILGLKTSMILRRIDALHEKYLQYHRNSVFKE